MVVVVVVCLERVLSRLWLRLTPSTLEALAMACDGESGLLCLRWRNVVVMCVVVGVVAVQWWWMSMLRRCVGHCNPA